MKSIIINKALCKSNIRTSRKWQIGNINLFFRSYNFCFPILKFSYSRSSRVKSQRWHDNIKWSKVLVWIRFTSNSIDQPFFQISRLPWLEHICQYWLLSNCNSFSTIICRCHNSKKIRSVASSDRQLWKIKSCHRVVCNHSSDWLTYFFIIYGMNVCLFAAVFEVVFHFSVYN